LDEVAPALAEKLGRGAQWTSPREETVTVRKRQITPSFRMLGEGNDAGVLVFLRDNREIAREAQQIKLASLGRLTASIAHNLRNPLSSVGHAGQLLAESPALGEQEQHLLEIIRRNTRRIDEIIESVLQLSRRDRAGPRSIDLATWAREFCADYRQVRALAPDRLALELSAEPLPVEVDPRHLHQIVANLCDNALEHACGTGAGVRIRIGVRRDALLGYTLLEVVDDGPGIPPDIAREIFTPFFTTSISGTGLGLYIARELSEANGIDLEYISETSGGSCFRMTFPG
jgi:two-component system sensor histidine kinase PilS (NtrC family)